MKEGCNLTPFLLQVGLSVSLTHRLGQLPYPGPLPQHQRKRPRLKEPFFLFFSSFFFLLSPIFFPLWWSLMKWVCVLVFLIWQFFLIIQICTFGLLILKNTHFHHCLFLSNQKKKLKNKTEKHLSPFSPKLHKYVTTGGPRHLNRLKVALAG